MNKTKCPESIEELEEWDKLIPLCRKDLYSQAKAKIESGAACSLSEASRQLGEALNRDPNSIRSSIQRERKSEGVALLHLPTQKYAPKTEYQKTIIEEYEQAKRENKEERQKEIADKRQKIANSAKEIPKDDRWNVYHADMTTWESTKEYDFIITDPPYKKQYIPLYEILAERSNRWLKGGGLLIVMCGQSYLDEIYKIMSSHVNYYWTGCYLTPGQPTPLRQVNVNTTWKPLLMFSKGKYNGKIFGDVFKSDANDKTLHEWGQSESGMYSIVSMICVPGNNILDPFCGAGTTGIAALRHGCLFDGLDIDEENKKISEIRLSGYDTKKE